VQVVVLQDLLPEFDLVLYLLERTAGYPVRRVERFLEVPLALAAFRRALLSDIAVPGDHRVAVAAQRAQAELAVGGVVEDSPELACLADAVPMTSVEDVVLRHLVPALAGEDGSTPVLAESPVVFPDVCVPALAAAVLLSRRAEVVASEAVALSAVLPCLSGFAFAAFLTAHSL
jgi:hypothetical protein